MKFLSALSAAALVATVHALPKAVPATVTASASASPTPSRPPSSTLTSTAICLTETNNGIVSTRWITATFMAPVPTSITVNPGTGGSFTVITPSSTTTWTPPTGTATTRDPWCTIKVPGGNGGAMRKRVLPREEAEAAVKEIVEKREMEKTEMEKRGYFEADTGNKALRQEDMLYCPG
ncbi:hypothetical protein BJ508DRAFT_418930 [Ascobolus immersus RN42]|uniref:Ig-like domain-containing protein n=1 Tax=Ascobolus immersus RN42 TaxID=1160509 RepID=A0A3N4HI37_ASCIM|nr:hypothetical protein BJ508DRAFT_418930 [Ascobolus immersus RN42]